MLADLSTAEMVKITVLVLRNRYYKANPILKKETFTEEDEIEIEKFLKRTKHPILLKHKMEFNPDECDGLVPWPIVKRSESVTTENFESFAFSVPFDSIALMVPNPPSPLASHLAKLVE